MNEKNFCIFGLNIKILTLLWMYHKYFLMNKILLILCWNPVSSFTAMIHWLFVWKYFLCNIQCTYMPLVPGTLCLLLTVPKELNEVFPVYLLSLLAHFDCSHQWVSSWLSIFLSYIPCSGFHGFIHFLLSPFSTMFSKTKYLCCWHHCSCYFCIQRTWKKKTEIKSTKYSTEK